MTKNIKDYLHLYSGCQCQIHYKSISAGQQEYKTKELTIFCIYLYGNDSHHCLKPILRPLSDLTEDDFYSFNQPGTENDILITATINKRWCAGWYDKKEYEERVKEELCTDPVELLYDLEDADHENVICCDKNGTISHGLNDDYCYFVDLPTQSNWINHLRKRSVDCDRLIESGLAIDKTTLTQITK